MVDFTLVIVSPAVETADSIAQLQRGVLGSLETVTGLTTFFGDEVALPVISDGYVASE